jgi:hypothetical protein
MTLYFWHATDIYIIHRVFSSLQAFRKFLVPGTSCAGAVFAAVALTAAEEKSPYGISKSSEDVSKTESCRHCHASPKLRPSELPLYGDEQDKAGR